VVEDQMSFFSHVGMPVKKDKGSLIRLPITVYASTLLLASWSPPELASSSG